MEKATATKPANYTPEQEQLLINGYTAGKPVEELAEQLGKSLRSCIAKLSRAGVYKKAAKVSKTGEPVQKKLELAQAIGAVLQLSEAEVEGMEKAPKTALQKIFKALAMSKPIDGDE